MISNLFVPICDFYVFIEYLCSSHYIVSFANTWIEFFSLQICENDQYLMQSIFFFLEMGSGSKGTKQPEICQGFLSRFGERGGQL